MTATSIAAGRLHLHARPREIRTADGFALWVAVYLVVAAAEIITFLFLQAPFQTPDAFDHFSRAMAVAHGQLWEMRRSGSSLGVLIPADASRVYLQFQHIAFHPAVKLTAGELATASRLHWSSHLVFVRIANTAGTPFPFYLPQAVGVDVARLLGLSLLAAYRLACAANGLTALAIGALAVVLTPVGRPVMVAVGCLPMTAALDASVNQDATLIAAGFLLVALWARAMSGADVRHSRAAQAVAVSVVAALLVMDRLPYLPVALLPASLAGAWGRDRSARAVALVGGAAAALVGGVWALVQPVGVQVRLPGVDAHTQLRHLFHDPWWGVGEVVRTVDVAAQPIGRQVVGVLGWLDTPLAGWAYVVAGAALVLAMVVRDRARPVVALPGWRWVGLVVFVVVVVLVVLAELITYTPAGSPEAVGLQGRYFLPLLPLLGMLWPPSLTVGGTSPAVRIVRLGAVVVLVAALVAVGSAAAHALAVRFAT